MKAVVVYESMYGNTHRVADAIGRGLAAAGDVVVVPVAQAGPAVVEGADLVVVGGPTHAHGMTRPSTRQAAVDQAKPDYSIDPSALGPSGPASGTAGPGVREWLQSIPRLAASSAAFDTRAGVAPAFLTGRASKGIAKQLDQHGFGQVAEPESFLVDKDNRLQPGEEERAEEWGARLAAAVASPSPRARG
jgi:hypothetical protein